MSTRIVGAENGVPFMLNLKELKMRDDDEKTFSLFTVSFHSHSVFLVIFNFHSFTSFSILFSVFSLCAFLLFEYSIVSVSRGAT